jgi:hypothetical protein
MAHGHSGRAQMALLFIIITISRAYLIVADLIKRLSYRRRSDQAPAWALAAFK